MQNTAAIPQTHSPAWVAQTWLSFVIAVGTTGFGIYFLPVEIWVKAFLMMGLLFSIGSTFSLAKTVRDMHESARLAARIDEARLHKMMVEHDPLAPPQV